MYRRRKHVKKRPHDVRHCDEVYTDLEETIEEQENRIEDFWKKGNQQPTEDVAEITMDPAKWRWEQGRLMD